MKPYQQTLFTPAGSPFDPATMKRETRLHVLQSFDSLYGGSDVPDTECLECGHAPVRAVPHMGAPFAYCTACSWHIEIDDEEDET